jgi:glycosyltransferase involved in cell wall biosynthesis
MAGGPLSAGEILIVSPATTAGWRTVEEELAGSLGRLGVAHRVERVELGASARLRRAWPLVDLVEAAGARRALRKGLASGTPQAVVVLTSTASLLAPVERLQKEGVRVAIRLDCPAAVNRPGPANVVQRALERRRLAAASLVIAMGPRSAETMSGLASRVVPLPVAIEIPAGRATGPDARVMAYTPDPDKKGLDTIARAWEGLGSRRGEAVLTVAGQDSDSGPAFLRSRGIEAPPAVEWLGRATRRDYLDLVRGASAFVSASRREDHGVAQLEALAAGTPLVTTRAFGAYEAEPLAEQLDPSLVTPAREPGALADALARALQMDGASRSAYRERATVLLQPFTHEACDAVVRDQVLPVLLG